MRGSIHKTKEHHGNFLLYVIFITLACLSRLLLYAAGLRCPSQSAHPGPQGPVGHRFLMGFRWFPMMLCFLNDLLCFGQGP